MITDTATVFDCDGPDCRNQAVLPVPIHNVGFGHGQALYPPPGWTVLLSGAPEPNAMQDRHTFCSRRCLHLWSQ